MAAYEYLVIYVGVEDGQVHQAYGSNNAGDGTAKNLGTIDGPAEDITQIQAKMNSILCVMPDSRIDTRYMLDSPGCRYVKVGGSWKRVCT